MARKSILQRIKNWLTGGGKSTPPKARVSNNRESRNVVSSNTNDRRAYVNAVRGERDDLKREDPWAKTKEAFKATSSKAKPDPKEQLRQKARSEREKERRDYYKATNDRYNVKGAKDKAEELKRRQAVKSRAFNADTAVAEEKHELKYHPVAYSAARRAARGASLTGELLEKKGTKGEAKKAQRYFEKNQNKVAGGVGEAVGTMASFGLTSGASKAVVKKALPKAVRTSAEKGGEKLAARLAEKKLIRKAAEKEVKNAVKKGVTKEASKEAVNRVAKQKAKELVENLGEDFAQNITTGALNDISRASANHKVGSKGWRKEVGESAALNFGLGGAATVGLPAAGKGIKRALGGVSEGAEKALKNSDVKVSLKRRRKTDVKLPNVRNFDTFDVDDLITEADFEAEGLPRNLARILAEDKASRGVAEDAAQTAANNRRGIAKGNIKPLAETLESNEFIPRSRNAEWRLAPRNAERVDTSVEGLSKNLDELKKQTPKTDKEKRALATRMNDVEDRLNRAKWRKEGGSNMSAMQRASRGEYAGFDMGKSTNSYQSDALEGKVKGKTATVVEMSPDEYIERAYRQIFKRPSEKGKAFSDIPETSENIAKYAEAMRNGEKFPLPYLDYTSAGQEGRHRALAAKAAGIDRIPVVVIDSETNPKALINDVAETADDFPYATTGADDRIPTDDLLQTEKNDARAEGERVAREAMENEPKEMGARQATNETAENITEVTQGQKEARKAYEEATGQTFGKDGAHASDDDILDALQKVEASKGTKASRKLSKAASSQVRVSTEDEAKIINDMLDDSEAFMYDVVHQKDMYREVAQDLKDNWDGWIDKLSDIADGGDWSGKEATKLLYMAQYLSEITDATASAEQDALAKTSWKVIKALSNTSAQTLNGRRAYVHLSRAGKMESALDDMVHILDDAIVFNREHRSAMKGLNKFERNSYIRAELLKDTRLRDCLKKLADTKTADEATEAYMEMMGVFNAHHKKSAYDVVNQIRYTGMLLNPKTHIRNVGGSAFFAPVRQTSNMVRAALEDRIADWAGLDVTKHGGLSPTAMVESWRTNPSTEAGKEALAAAQKMSKEILGSSKYDVPINKGRATTFAGKRLDGLSDFNSLLLTKEDDFFRMRAFRENYIKSYNRYLKDGKPITDKIKRRIELEALNESQIATFNEANDLAKFLNGITRKASDANATTLQRWGGRTLNAVMPFEKVPANLMKQSINYSPLGIANGVANIRSAAAKGDAALLNQAIDNLASGLTGTGIFVLGTALGTWTDMFTTNAGKEDPAAKFKKRQGVQNYSMTVTDPKTGKTVSVTLDWLVPTSATFFSGVEMANQLKAGGFNVLDIFGDWGTVASRLAEPVMETSMLSGLHGMLETLRGGYGDDDTQGAIAILAREIGQSYINSLIPTLAGQISRTFVYDTDKQILGNGDREYWINSLRSKAGLGNTNILGEALGADTDSFGNVKGKKEDVGDYAASFLKNFISPANIQKVDLSEIDKAKLDEYERRVKNGEDPSSLEYLFPKKQNKKSFSVAGDEVQMSNKDVSTYNQAKTTGGAEGMRYALESIMFNRRTTDEKGKNVPRDDAYTQEMKDALMAQFEGKSMRDVEKWVYAQPEFKNATPAERQKLINGLWTLDNPYNNTTANASRRVGEQAVIKAQGGDVDEYNFKNEVTESKREALMPAIEAGLVTYAQVVDFDRNASKKGYYETDDGGKAVYTYNQGTIMDYLSTVDAPEETKKALYDAYYTGKQTYEQALAKHGKGKGRGGYRRRRGGYRRYSSGGSKAKVPTTKVSDYKASKATYKSMASSLPKRKRASSSPVVKVEPPKVKFKKYEV